MGLEMHTASEASPRGGVLDLENLWLSVCHSRPPKQPLSSGYSL